MIGNKLKELRVKNSYTQSHVAKYLNISWAMYQKIEYGESALSLDKLLLLCKLYRVSPNYILKGCY